MFFKNKITFKYLDHKFSDIYPPIESKKIFRPCLKKFNASNKNALEELKNPTCPFKKIFNTAKCPGILDLISIGYIIRLHRDIRIQTKNENEGFEWDILENEQDIDDPTLSKTVSYFLPNQFSDHYELPKGSLTTLIKISLPWHVQSKKYNFIVLQPSYFEENRFTVMNGILNPDYSPQLNVILLWNKLNCVEILKAGTPLCQIIPIDKKNGTIINFEEIKESDLLKEKDILFKNKLTNF